MILDPLADAEIKGGEPGPKRYVETGRMVGGGHIQRAGVLDIQPVYGKKAMGNVLMGLVVFGQKPANAILFMQFDQKRQGDIQG